MKDFETLLEQELEYVEDSRVRDAMMYSLMAGGKRIRPNLLFATLKGYGTDEKVGVPFACALEMIHTYSLIHDDLPAMDNDDLRRGKPTCHKQFDEATAILAGDGLLTEAFNVCTHSDADASAVLDCISILAANAGANGMILGQCLDLAAEETPIDFEGLKQIHLNKTGRLLAAPLMMAATLAGHPDECYRWNEVGTLMGLAFQIQDDIFDVTLTREQFGKSISDIDNNKTTSVSLLGLEGAQKLMDQLYAKVLEMTGSFVCFDPQYLNTLIRSVVERNH